MGTCARGPVAPPRRAAAGTSAAQKAAASRCAPYGSIGGGGKRYDEFAMRAGGRGRGGGAQRARLRARGAVSTRRRGHCCGARARESH